MRMHLARFAVIAALAGLFSCGCSKNSTSAPVPLSEDEIPSAFDHAFGNSDKATRDLADRYVDSMKKHDAPEAFDEIHELFHKAGLTADQRGIVARALVTTSQKAQEAAANGDERASDALNARVSAK